MTRFTRKCRVCKKAFTNYTRERYCSPECLKKLQQQYFKQYIEENKEELRKYHNDRRERLRKAVVYFLMEQNEIFYVGSTDVLPERLAYWFSCDRKVLFKEHQISNVQFIDVSSIVQNKKELRFLEQLFFEKHMPTLNEVKPSRYRPSGERQRELKQFFELGRYDIQEYNISRYLSKITVDTEATGASLSIV